MGNINLKVGNLLTDLEFAGLNEKQILIIKKKLWDCIDTAIQESKGGIK